MYGTGFSSLVVQLHPLCCQELKKHKETWELEKNLQKCLVYYPLPPLTLSPLSSFLSSLPPPFISLPLPPPSLLLQDVLEAHLSPSNQTTPTDMTSDLLKQALSVYLRLALHRGAESEGDCKSVRERMREVWKWTNQILLPLLRGEM